MAIATAETVLEIVEKQRKSLISEDYEERNLAVKEINSKIETEILNVREVAVLTEFYRERLKDAWHVHGTVMKGMLALARQPKYPGSALIRLMPILENDLHVQSLSSADRVTCCEFFREVLSRHPDHVSQLGHQFTSLIISSFDGETDPRVLMKNFALVSLIQKKHLPGESSRLWDEILDVCACYFPVEFAPDEKDCITRDDLSNALTASLTAGLRSKSRMANKMHSSTLIDLIIEKASSESPQAINDSMELMKTIIPYLDYEVFSVSEKFNQLIRVIVVKIGQRHGDEKAQKVVVDALELLAKAFTNHSNYAEKGLDYILELTEEFLQPPFKPALWPSIKIIATWSLSGSNSLNKCLPFLLPAFSNPISAGEALDAIVSLANTSLTGSKNEKLADCLLDSIKNQTVPVQTKLISISAVAACTKADLITEKSLRKIGLEVLKLSIKSSSSEIAKEAAHCLAFIGQKDPDFIRTEVLPDFQDKSLIEERSVQVLAQFIAMEGFIGYEISQKLIFMIRDNHLNRSWDLSVYAALDGMAKIFPEIVPGEVKSSIAELVIKEIFDALIVGIMCCGQDRSRITPLLEEKGMANVCNIVRGLSPSLTNPGDLRFKIWETFTENSLSRGNGPSKIYFKPFDANYSYNRNQLKTLPFLTTFMCCCTPSSVPGNWNEYTQFMFKVLTNVTSPPEMRKSAAKMLAAVINKNDQIDDEIWAMLKKLTSSSNERALALLVWITKGILLKGGKNLDLWLQKLIAMACESNEIGRMAADSWWILLADTPDLSKQSLARVKLLYSQRLFNMTLPNIKKVVDSKDDIDGEKTAMEGNRKENMMIILGHLLSMVPSEVQSRELPPLLPLIFECLTLESGNDGLLDSSLSTITQLKESSSEVVQNILAEHAETLIARFLKIIYRKVSLRVRVKAFKSLIMITNMTTIDPVIVRSREWVLRTLKSALDDPKRVIRKEASLAWNVWAMVGEP